MSAEQQPTQSCAALHRAARLGIVYRIQCLLNMGAWDDIHSTQGPDRRTPVHTAAAAGMKRAVQTLLAAGADPNCRDLHGLTPLHIAAQRGQVSVVKVLKQEGADLRSRTLEGETPLDLARRAGHSASVLALLEPRGGAPGERVGCSSVSAGSLPLDAGSGTIAGCAG